MAGYDLPAWRLPAPSVAVSPPRPPSRPEPTKEEAVLATGTGFIINGRGDVITNNHVVVGCSQISFGLNGQRLVLGTLVVTDAKDDVAVVNF